MSPSNNCAGCRKPLPKREFLICMLCKSGYDLECANTNFKLFNLMKRKEEWKCPECLCRRPKTGNVNTPIRHNETDVVASQKHQTECTTVDNEDCLRNITLRTKGSQSTIQIEQTADDSYEGISRHSESAMIDDLKRYMNHLIHTEMTSLHEALTNLTNICTAQSTRIEQLEQKVTALENKQETTCICDMSTLQSKLSQLEAEISERDQASLSNDIEISGCTETQYENCTHIVLSVAKKIGVELDEKDLVSAERAGPARPREEQGTVRPRPLVVRVARRATRDAILQAARVRRSLTTEGLQLPGSVNTLYVNERLTKHNRLLFWKARRCAREQKFTYVWTRDGKIFVRRNQGEPRHRLRSEADLYKVFEKLDI